MLSFGRLVGVDGRVHVGVEIDPFVVPISTASLKDAKRSLGGQGRLVRWLHGERQPEAEAGGWI